MLAASERKERMARMESMMCILKVNWELLLVSQVSPILRLCILKREELMNYYGKSCFSIAFEG